jgi:hypothetical protein
LRSRTARTRLAEVLVKGRMHAAAYCDNSEYYRITKQDGRHRAENNAVVRNCDQSAHRERNGARDSTRLPQPAITPHARTVTEQLPSTESATAMACVTADLRPRSRGKSALNDVWRTREHRVCLPGSASAIILEVSVDDRGTAASPLPEHTGALLNCSGASSWGGRHDPSNPDSAFPLAECTSFGLASVSIGLRC